MCTDPFTNIYLKIAQSLLYSVSFSIVVTWHASTNYLNIEVCVVVFECESEMFPSFCKRDKEWTNLDMLDF